MEHAHVRRCRITAVCGLAVLLAACGKELPPAPQLRGDLSDGVTPAESLAIGSRMGSPTVAAATSSGQTCTLDWSDPNMVLGCSAPLPAVMPLVPWLEQSGQAVDSGEIEYRGPITIAFPTIVRGLTLSSTGAVSCSGTFGQMIGFRHGVQVAQEDNTLIDPNDCGADGVTYGVQGQLPPDADIDSLVIEGVDPWTFMVDTLMGRALLQYTVTYEPFDEVACDSVVRGQVTTCQLGVPVDSVSGWEFTGRLATTHGSQSDTVRITSASTSGTWVGIGVLSGVVSAYVVTNGNPDTLSGPLVVTNRTGAAWRWTEADWMFHKDGPTLCAYSAFQTPFPSPNPGMLAADRRTSRCDGGSIEPDVTGFPDSGFTADSVPSGPNDGLWYVVAASYYMDHTSEANPFVRPGGPTDTLTDTTDMKACRRPLGLGRNDPIIVNFYTYNFTCQRIDSTEFFPAIWSHEGFGTQDSLDPAVANGHEARRWIAARDTLNDPNRIVESEVNVSREFLGLVVVDSVLRADLTISAASDPDHLFVKDNYIVNGGKCGQAWVYDTPSRKYVERPMHHFDADSNLVCL